MNNNGEDILTYEFTEFDGRKAEKVGNAIGEQELARSEDQIKFKHLIKEVDDAEEAEFRIDKSVFDLRNHKEAKKSELEQAIEARIQEDLEKVRQGAYDDGYEKGLQEGVLKSYQEESANTEKKMQELNGMIQNLMNRQEEMVKTQDRQFNKLIRDLVKWVTLKELEKDDNYIYRLVGKIVSENKTSSRLNFQIGSGVVASFSSSIEKINEHLEVQYQGRVNISENKNIPKDGIEVELDSNIIQAGIHDQLAVFDQLFDGSCEDL